MSVQDITPEIMSAQKIPPEIMSAQHLTPEIMSTLNITTTPKLVNTPCQGGRVKKLTQKWESMVSRRYKTSSINLTTYCTTTNNLQLIKNENPKDNALQNTILPFTKSAEEEEVISWRRGRPGPNCMPPRTNQPYPKDILEAVKRIELRHNLYRQLGIGFNAERWQIDEAEKILKQADSAVLRSNSELVCNNEPIDKEEIPIVPKSDEEFKRNMAPDDSQPLDLYPEGHEPIVLQYGTPFVPPKRAPGFKQWRCIDKAKALEVVSWRDIPQHALCLYPKALAAHRMDVFEIYDAVKPAEVAPPKEIFTVLPQSFKRRLERKMKNFFSGAFLEARKTEPLTQEPWFRKEWWTTFPPYILASYMTYFDCNVYQEALRETLDPLNRVIERRAFPCDDLGLFPITDPDNMIMRMQQLNVYSQRWVDQIQVLLDDPTVPRLARILKLQTMIKVVEWLHYYKNYQGMVAFMTGIQLSKLIDKKNVLCEGDRAQYNQMLKIVDPAGNYAQLRWLMRPIAGKGFDEGPWLVPFAVPWIREMKRAKEAEDLGIGEGHVLNLIRRIRASIKRPLPWHADVDSRWMQWFKRKHNMWAWHTDFAKTKMDSIKIKCYGVRDAARYADNDLAKEIQNGEPLGFQPGEFDMNGDGPFDQGFWTDPNYGGPLTLYGVI